MMTNLDIDQSLLKRAVAPSGGKSLLDLFGKVDWDPDYDYKAERTRK
jgi:hypothetical protein